MRNRRTIVLVVVLLAIAALGGWLWYARQAAARPEDEVVQKANELESAYQEAGGKAIDEQLEAEREQLEAAEPEVTEPTRGPTSVDG